MKLSILSYRATKQIERIKSIRMLLYPLFILLFFIAPRISDQLTAYATTCVNDTLKVSVSKDGIHESTSNSITLYKDDEGYFIHVRNASGVPCRVNQFDASVDGGKTSAGLWHDYQGNEKTSSLGITYASIPGFPAGTSTAQIRPSGSTGGWSNPFTVIKSNTISTDKPLLFDTASKIYGYFKTDHYTTTLGSSLPSTMSLSTATSGDSKNTMRVAITNKGGIIFTNPAANDSFYRVDVTMEDTGQQNLIGFLTLTDKLWSEGAVTTALSIGIDTIGLGTPGRKNSYVYSHLGLKPLNTLTASQQTFDNTYSNTYIKRANGDVTISIYVTPNGTYPVLNGFNMGSLPNLYRGSATYFNTQPFKYIVLSKWNDGGDPVAFKKLSVTKLPTASTNVADIDKYFITTPFGSPAFIDDLWNIDTSTADQRGTFIWLAALYRVKDYYFGTNSKNEVQYLFDKYLASPSISVSSINTEIAKFSGTNANNNLKYCGYEETAGIVEECPVSFIHSVINARQSEPFLIYLLSDYLTPEEKDTAQQRHKLLLDESVRRMKTDGIFPRSTFTNPNSPYKTNYMWDTYAEEPGWMLDYITGYYLAFPYDYELTQVPNQAVGVKKPRAELLVDYINFFGFHTLTNDPTEPLTLLYGNTVAFKHLDSSFRTFKSQYIWQNGLIDNHGLHPSLNYSYGIYGSVAIARNLLLKNGINIEQLNHNLSLAFLANTYDLMDIKTLRHKVPITQIFGTDSVDQNTKRILNNPEDWYIDTEPYNDGIFGFSGRTKPSLLEDWGNTYTGYHVGVNYGGDPAYALSWAQSVYYLYYNGVPGLFFHWPVMEFYKKVGDPFSPYTQAIYSTFFSQQQALGKLKPGDMNRDGVVNGSDMNLVIGRYSSNVQDMVEDIDDNGVFNAVDMRAFHE